VSSVAAADYDTIIDWEIPAPYPTSLRDPTEFGPVNTVQPETTKTETAKIEKLSIKGILYSKDNPSVVIGNQIVHEGEKIRDVTVIKISKDSVEFEKNGRRWIQKVQ
jgi:type II secretory pathway component PulC